MSLFFSPAGASPLAWQLPVDEWAADPVWIELPECATQEAPQAVLRAARAVLAAAGWEAAQVRSGPRLAGARGLALAVDAPVLDAEARGAVLTTGPGARAPTCRVEVRESADGPLLRVLSSSRADAIHMLFRTLEAVARRGLLPADGAALAPRYALRVLDVAALGSGALGSGLPGGGGGASGARGGASGDVLVLAAACGFNAVDFGDAPHAAVLEGLAGDLGLVASGQVFGTDLPAGLTGLDLWPACRGGGRFPVYPAAELRAALSAGTDSGPARFGLHLSAGPLGLPPDAPWISACLHLAGRLAWDPAEDPEGAALDWASARYSPQDAGTLAQLLLRAERSTGAVCLDPARLFGGEAEPPSPMVLGDALGTARSMLGLLATGASRLESERSDLEHLVDLLAWLAAWDEARERYGQWLQGGGDLWGRVWAEPMERLRQATARYRSHHDPRDFPPGYSTAEAEALLARADGVQRERAFAVLALLAMGVLGWRALRRGLPRQAWLRALFPLGFLTVAWLAAIAWRGPEGLRVLVGGG